MTFLLSPFRNCIHKEFRSNWESRAASISRPPFASHGSGATAGQCSNSTVIPIRDGQVSESRGVQTGGTGIVVTVRVTGDLASGIRDC